MAWTDGANYSTGQLITSTIWNNYLGAAGNIDLTAPGVVTTAGDTIYATGDNTIARLPSSGEGGKFLRMNAGETAPEYATALTSLVADTSPQLGGQLDVNGNAIGDGTLELLKFAETGSAVNELTITNAATGNPPALSATGGDADINLKLAGKGTGGLEIGATADTASKLILAEDTDNGTEAVIQAALSLARLAESNSEACAAIGAPDANVVPALRRLLGSGPITATQYDDAGGAGVAGAPQDPLWRRRTPSRRRGQQRARRRSLPGPRGATRRRRRANGPPGQPSSHPTRDP